LGAPFRPPGAAGVSAAEQVPAAVLLPVFYRDQQAHLVLTKRRADLRRHAGEISFPGGRQDPEDPDLRSTALREAEEEIGLPSESVEVLGELSPVSTFVTGYLIHPFVGLIDSQSSFKPSPGEVAEVLQVSLDDLSRSLTKTTLERRGITFQTDAYVLGEEIIWGATARIVAELLERLGMS
jgi:8-oxo-dGTP pyrophosphatase MutT (NUDIX family)